MNNMKHTPEPWSLHEVYHANPNLVPISTYVPACDRGSAFTSWECVIASGGCIVSQVTGWSSTNGGFPRADNPEEVVANAQRIIACVNACAGINPDAVPDLLDALERCDPGPECIIEEECPYGSVFCELSVGDMRAIRAALAKAKATDP